jgi:hypothetical protein
MDHWALLMMKDPEEPHLLQATSLQHPLAHAPRLFSGEVHACRLLVLLLRGGPTAPRFPCPCVLAAGAGGTAQYRCRRF